jgi:hypothetical protein
MSGSSSALLQRQLERARGTIRARLAGLTDDEFFWQPVADSWTIRPSRPGEEHLNGSGEWIYDYAMPDPDPPPFTTIGWRLIHIGGINDMYFEHVFGAGLRDYPDQRIPHKAAAAVVWWEQGIRKFLEQLAEAEDSDLERVVTVPWEVTQSVEEWLGVLLYENIHHGAEIGVLRDLYREGFGARRAG